MSLPKYIVNTKKQVVINHGVKALAFYFLKNKPLKR